MFPKQLKRASVFESGVVKPDPERPGLYSLEGTYAVRSMEQYFEPTGTYLPRDWSTREERVDTARDSGIGAAYGAAIGTVSGALGAETGRIEPAPPDPAEAGWRREGRTGRYREDLP